MTRPKKGTIIHHSGNLTVGTWDLARELSEDFICACNVTTLELDNNCKGEKGRSRFVKHPVVPLKRPIAMFKDDEILFVLVASLTPQNSLWKLHPRYMLTQSHIPTTPPLRTILKSTLTRYGNTLFFGYGTQDSILTFIVIMPLWYATNEPAQGLSSFSFCPR